MSDYNYEIIKASVIEWYEKALSELKNKDEIILTKNSDDALIIDFDFQNCIVWALPFQYTSHKIHPI